MINLIKIFDYAKEDLWRDIKDYEDLYQVSHTGKVRSLNYKHTGKIQELKTSITTNGYYRVNLHKGGKNEFKRVHRLVAEVFIPNPENKPYIDHRDTNRLNNHVNNLRWVTTKENCNNEISKVNMSLSKIGERHPISKKIFLYDKNKKFIWGFDTKGQLAFYLSKYTKYKVNTIETTFLQNNSKYTIVNNGILFADKFYIFDYQIEEKEEEVKLYEQK